MILSLEHCLILSLETLIRKNNLYIFMLNKRWYIKSNRQNVSFIKHKTNQDYLSFKVMRSMVCTFLLNSVKESGMKKGWNSGPDFCRTNKNIEKYAHDCYEYQLDSKSNPLKFLVWIPRIIVIFHRISGLINTYLLSIQDKQDNLATNK